MIRSRYNDKYWHFLLFCLIPGCMQHGRRNDETMQTLSSNGAAVAVQDLERVNGTH